MDHSETSKYLDVHKKLSKARLPIFRIDQLEEVLKKKYKAYEIPLYTIDREDYKNDEEVNEKDIYKLYTITDQSVIKKLRNYQDREAIGGESIDEYLKEYNTRMDTLNYDRLIMEHNVGTRLSIVLETKGNNDVSNFKVYGHAYYLVAYLVARVGMTGMIYGDLSDESYQFYLECLVDAGLIK